MIKVAITGPEASGKSELAQQLAHYYSTSYAPEFARTYLEGLPRKYNIEDLDKITLGQINEEESAIVRADEICFFDTDMLVMQVWSSFRFDKISPVIERALSERSYDFWLLCKPDLPWKDDPLRESPDQEERDELFNIYHNLLSENHPKDFSVIEGFGTDRFRKALSVVQRLI